jgi:hypothetical protein
MSAWKLVEAEVDEPAQSSSSKNNGNYGGMNNGNNVRGKGGGRGRGDGRGVRNFRGRGEYKTPHISRQERNYRSHMAAQQVELIFSPDNLCMDTYIRSYMDEAGFVPIALVYNYPNVAQFGALYQDLKYRLKELTKENRSSLEVDTTNELLRVSSNWEMWLMPNQFGGRGQPRYIKEANGNYAGNGFGLGYGYGVYDQQQQPQMQYNPDEANAFSEGTNDTPEGKDSIAAPQSTAGDVVNA